MNLSIQEKRKLFLDSYDSINYRTFINLGNVTHADYSDLTNKVNCISFGYSLYSLTNLTKEDSLIWDKLLITLKDFKNLNELDFSEFHKEVPEFFFTNLKDNINFIFNPSVDYHPTIKKYQAQETINFLKEKKINLLHKLDLIEDKIKKMESILNS